jgi:hypothetical protein
MVDETWPRREFCSFIVFEQSSRTASRKLGHMSNQHQAQQIVGLHLIRKGLGAPSFRVSLDVSASWQKSRLAETE